MTALYTQNFDALSDGTPTGWTASAGSGIHCYVASTAGNTAVSGTRVIGRNGVGDSANCTIAGSLTNQAMRSAQINIRSAHMHRCGSDATTQGYVYVPEFDGTNMRVRIFDVSGFTELGNSGFVLAFTAGDTLHMETSAIGSTLSARIWKNSQARPASPTLSVTNSTYASGYVGVQQRVSTDWGALDNVVITDGAGGEDYFYPESSGTTITGNFSAATASGFAASIAAATIISCALGTGNAQGYQSTVQIGSNTTITASLGTATASGFSAAVAVSGTGTLITEPLKNNTGTLLASQTGATAFIYNTSSGALVVAKTGQTTDGSGVMTITDALISPATQYRVVVVLSGGAEGMAKYTAS